MTRLTPLRSFLLCIVLILSVLQVSAQSSRHKYPSLLWEITGNGMKKPSYLFGTMHISNKMVFHLSDSFYTAIRRADVVALELSPELWQADIPRMNRQSAAYQRFACGYSDDYIHEKTFISSPFIPQMQRALSVEPALNNSLLYRTDQSQEDFEENTYLDLYIYQTGRKLGKKATGVEQFMQSQRMAVEAYLDAALDKGKKKNRRNTDINPYEVMQATQDAYRNGDLDLLDSLNDLTEQSAAFTEKFLYKRNEIQARSMDSIMHHQALFVGVGAAHLPGPRGVIEILRRKGYTLRPVKMQDRDAVQKDVIDSLRVPVHFVSQWAEDSAYRVAAPGPLQPLEGNSQSQMDYADMANGSYYLITRVKTHPLFSGYTPDRVLQIADSLFYEAIPGRILTKTKIEKFGHKGYEIINRTRRGDIQRYQIFAMPDELIVFKMGGTDKYVSGPEADTFFNSIRLRSSNASIGYQYGPAEGSFRAVFPLKPVAQYVYNATDGEPLLTAEATDPATGESFLLMKKDIYTFQFLDVDTFCASLGIESAISKFPKSDILERKNTVYNGYAAADAIVRGTDGQYLFYRSVVQGPRQFLLAARTKNRSSAAVQSFLNSLTFSNTNYGAPSHFKDTFLKIEVKTPVALELDADVAGLVAYSRTSALRARDISAEYSSSPERRNANFFSESTGELVTVDASTFPAYYFVKKKDRFWNNEIKSATGDSDMVLQSKEAINLPDGTTGYSLTIGDTGSSRVIKKMLLLKGMTLYTIATEIDSKLGESSFIKTFFSTVKPYAVSATPSIFDSKYQRFFTNYYSKDSLTHARAVEAISSTYFGPEGFTRIVEAIAKLKPGSPEYYTLKPKFISELSYVSDSTNSSQVLAALKKIYLQSGDTSWIQNSVLTSIGRLQTAEATKVFKDLLLQDPPVFDDESDYQSLFSPFEDTLKLGALLFPEILQLVPIADFKPSIISLLAKEVDSNFVKPSVYENMVSNLYFDAKIALKKELSGDESARESAARLSAKGGDADDYISSRYLPASDTTMGTLYDYAILLAPFYDQNPNIPKFFDRLLAVRTPELRLQTALLMRRYHKPVPDSLWRSLASNVQYRSRLYDVLSHKGLLSLYPQPLPQQEELIRSHLYAGVSNIIGLKLVSRQEATIKGRHGYIYAFKYRVRGTDDWKLAVNGPQPLNTSKYDADPLVESSSIEIPSGKSPEKKVQEIMLRNRIVYQPAGKVFYSSEDGENNFTRYLQQYRSRSGN